MNDFEKKYMPFNFSENRTHIITLSVPVGPSPFIPGYVKIESKLPNYIQHLTGIYVTCSRPPEFPRLAGYLVLNFNGLALNCVQIPVMKSTLLRRASTQPFPLNEQIIPNSFLQGYYMDVIGLGTDYPYNVFIYLHYKRLD